MSLKIDKTYSTKEKKHFDKYTPPYKKVLKFYSNHIVIGAAISTPYEGLEKWFNKNNENVSKGTYKVNENEISFTLKSELGIVTYKGQISKDNLILDFNSQINNQTGKDEFHLI